MLIHRKISQFGIIIDVHTNLKRRKSLTLPTTRLRRYGNREDIPKVLDLAEFFKNKVGIFFPRQIKMRNCNSLMSDMEVRKSLGDLKIPEESVMARRWCKLKQ